MKKEVDFFLDGTGKTEEGGMAEVAAILGV